MESTSSSVRLMYSAIFSTSVHLRAAAWAVRSFHSGTPPTTTATVSYVRNSYSARGCPSPIGGVYAFPPPKPHGCPICGGCILKASDQLAVGTEPFADQDGPNGIQPAVDLILHVSPSDELIHLVCHHVSMAPPFRPSQLIHQPPNIPPAHGIQAHHRHGVVSRHPLELSGVVAAILKRARPVETHGHGLTAHSSAV